MSNRNLTGPDLAFHQLLDSMAARIERMEKRQRWQGATLGPITLYSAGWALAGAGGSALTNANTPFGPAGAWLVVAFCTWVDDGADDPYTFGVHAYDMAGAVSISSIGSVQIPNGVTDPGRWRSTTLAGRVSVDAPFRIRVAADGGLGETASVSNVNVDTIAFPV